MPALPVSQQSDWNNNVYVLATTRIFVMIGMAYLIKILYNLVPSTWSTRFASAAAVVSDAVGLENITSDIPVTVPGAISAGPDLEANLTGPDLETNPTLNIRPPQPSYDPQRYAERARANARAQHRGVQVSDRPTATHAIQEQDVVVRGGDAHTEEDLGITVGLIG